MRTFGFEPFSKARKQLLGVAVQHGWPFARRQRRCIPHSPCRSDRNVAQEVRVVRTEQHLIEANDLPQHVENRRAERQRGVPMKPAQRCGRSTARFSAGNASHLIDNREASGEIRDRTAGMREDVWDMRRAREAAPVVHLCNRARGIRSKVDKVVWQSQLMRRGIRPGIWMDEDDAPPSFEFREERLEAIIAEIDTVRVPVATMSNSTDRCASNSIVSLMPVPSPVAHPVGSKVA